MPTMMELFALKNHDANSIDDIKLDPEVIDEIMLHATT